MKRLSLCAMTLILANNLSGLTLAQQTAEQREQFAARMPQQKLIQFTADSMRRANDVVLITGNVEVQITPLHPDDDPTVIRADEVIYHLGSGEIETRGNARVTIKKARDAKDGGGV